MHYFMLLLLSYVVIHSTLRYALLHVIYSNPLFLLDPATEESHDATSGDGPLSAGPPRLVLAWVGLHLPISAADGISLCFLHCLISPSRQFIPISSLCLSRCVLLPIYVLYHIWKMIRSTGRSTCHGQPLLSSLVTLSLGNISTLSNEGTAGGGFFLLSDCVVHYGVCR